MRLGPILVPSAIAIAVGTIVAAQSGWLDAGWTGPVYVGSGPVAVQATTAMPRRSSGSVRPSASAPAIVVETAEPTAIGRSVGKNGEAPHPGAASNARGSGGASLDSDADVGAAAATSDSSAGSDALQQARDEAAKAKQDVLEVTQASISAQHASEAEFERQKAELNDQITQLRAKADNGAARSAGVDPAAEAKAATAMAELADARERENSLRTKLAAAQAGGSADGFRKEAADKVAAAERASAEAQGRARGLEERLSALKTEAAATRNALDKAAAERIAAAEQARDAAKDRLQHLEEGKAALEADAAAGRAASDKVAKAERAATEAQADAASSADKVAALQTELARKIAAMQTLAAAQDRVKALGSKVEALQSELAANRTTATLVVAKTETVDRLTADFAAARKRETALNGQITALQAGAAQSAKAKDAETIAAKKVSLLQQQLEDAHQHAEDLGTKVAALQASAAGGEARLRQAQAAAGQVDILNRQLAAAEGREKDLGVRLAALQTKKDAGVGDSPKPADGQVLALQVDLAGARRGEDTLRKENGVLQRELTQAQVVNKSIGERLAALQVGMGHPVPADDDDAPRRDHFRKAHRNSEHEHLVRQLERLRREQMHQQVQALKAEAVGFGRARSNSQSMSADYPAQSAQSAVLKPQSDTRLTRAERRAARRRERQVTRERDAAFMPASPQASGAGRFSAVSQSAAGDSTAAISEAKSLIRSGNIDKARQVLRQRGTAAATRALADSYNPLTNTQYGVIGVDSDADRAAFLYQQAARAAR